MTDSSGIPDGPIESDLLRDDDSFAELVEQFVEELGEKVRQMEDAVRAADFEALRVAAHQLKGSGGGYGYPILTDRAAQLEQHAKSAAIDKCLDAFAELKEICGRVVVSTDDRE